MLPLKKKKTATKVKKMCVYCGHMPGLVMSASVNCPMCHKRGLRTIYGENNDGSPRIVED